MIVSTVFAIHAKFFSNQKNKAFARYGRVKKSVSYKSLHLVFSIHPNSQWIIRLSYGEKWLQLEILTNDMAKWARFPRGVENVRDLSRRGLVLLDPIFLLRSFSRFDRKIVRKLISFKTWMGTYYWGFRLFAVGH